MKRYNDMSELKTITEILEAERETITNIGKREGMDKVKTEMI